MGRGWERRFDALKEELQGLDGDLDIARMTAAALLRELEEIDPLRGRRWREGHPWLLEYVTPGDGGEEG